MGYNTNVSGSANVCIGAGSSCTGTRANAFGAGVSNTTANSLLIDAITNIRSNTNGTTDLGTTSRYFKDIYANGSLSGPIGTRLIDNIVSNDSTGATGNICTFLSDKVIQDSGVPISSVVGPFLPTAGGTMTGGITGTFYTSSTTTDSTTTATGAITTSGGLGVAKATNVGTNLKVFGTTDSTTTSTGSFQCLGGCGITKSVFVGDNMSILGSLESSSTSTGSLKCSGGLGVAKSAFIGNICSIVGTSNSSSTTTGSLITAGGLGVVKDVYIGGVLNAILSTDSTSTTTGSLITSGGLGVAKKAYVGDSVFVNTTSATAKIVVSGGVQNTAGEDSSIRAISSSSATKIELSNTTASTGKLWEARSLSSGGFDITDRTGAATRLTIDTNGNIGFWSTSFGGGVKVINIQNCTTVPTSNPVNGGLFYVEAGAFKYRGPSGTVTTIAPA
jgi:hypothetical protein